jgi:hypothetical protein
VFNCDADFAAKDLRKMTCYVCGAAGHLCCAPMDAAFESWNAEGDAKKKKSCCRCGGVGHVDSECAQGRRFGAFAENGRAGPSGASSVFACFKCGETGHIARECPGSLAGPQPAGDLRSTLGGGGGGSGGPDRGQVRQTKYGAVAGGGGGRIRRKRRERPKRLRGPGQLGRGGRARRRRLGRRGAGRRATGRRRERGRARPRAGGVGGRGNRGRGRIRLGSVRAPNDFLAPTQTRFCKVFGGLNVHRAPPARRS